MLISCILLAALIALQAGDWLTTARAFAQNPTAYEANPVMAWAIAHLSFRGAMIAKVALVSICGVVCALEGSPGLITLAALCGLYAWVVWHNWRLG